MTNIRPDYYRKDGHDLFDHFETGVLTNVQFVGFMVGNIIKYIVRYQGKNGLEDLYKARTYLDRLIQHEEGKDGRQRN